MENENLERDVQKRLILAGIRELYEHGDADFSLRRVAASSGVSCAAPYKHFKNREELLLKILEYVNSKWDLLFSEICKAYEGDTKRCIVESSAAALRFFNANGFSAVVFSRPAATGKEGERDHILGTIDDLVRRFCGEQNNGDGEKLSFAVRAMLSGAVLMTNGRDAAHCEETASLLRERVGAIL